MKRLNLFFIAIFSMIQFSFSQEIDTAKYCNNIKSEIDKFTGETKYRTPLLSQICFFKTIKENTESNINMMIRTIGSTPSTGEGVTILLENGEKIFKNIETSVRVNRDAEFEHFAFFSLNSDDIEMLKKYNITDTRLYIFDMEITDPVQYKAYIFCLEGIK